MKEMGEIGYHRNRRMEVTIRDGKIGRYEMRKRRVDAPIANSVSCSIRMVR